MILLIYRVCLEQFSHFLWDPIRNQWKMGHQTNWDFEINWKTLNLFHFIESILNQKTWREKQIYFYLTKVKNWFGATCNFLVIPEKLITIMRHIFMFICKCHIKRKTFSHLLLRLLQRNIKISSYEMLILSYFPSFLSLFCNFRWVVFP